MSILDPVRVKEPLEARFRLEIEHMRHTMLQHFNSTTSGLAEMLDRAIVDGLQEASKNIVAEAQSVIREECGRRARNLAYIITDDDRFKERLRQIVIDALPEAGL